VLTPAQFSKLTPLVSTAWAARCRQRGLDPSRKKANRYREWYEEVLFKAIGRTSTADVRNAAEFGRVLLAFAEISDNENLVRDLAADEENRNRWVLRMLAVDLSFLRCERVGWDYVRGIYEHSQLPPGEFDDCPANLLLKVIAMLDTQIRRECDHYGISKHHLPRRAGAALARMPHHAAAALQEKMLHVLHVVAAHNGHDVPALVRWHDKMLAEAEADHRARRRSLTGHPEDHSVTTDSTSAQGEIPF
jgi:hypothetical protein